jgi:hypothetical protein
MKVVGKFYGYLVCFLPFGIFYGPLAYFVIVLVYFYRFLVFRPAPNVASAVHLHR